MLTLLLSLTLAQPKPFLARVADAARARPALHVRYDGAYRVISYPNGDVSADIGVCSDEVIRVYRAVGIDLQRLVHEDMVAHFASYPRTELSQPDANIDHRRVVNLRAFFARHGASLPVTSAVADYLPGDLVTWRLSGGKDHIGIVIGPNLVEHNIGEGPKAERVLFAWPITGHYRYTP